MKLIYQAPSNVSAAQYHPEVTHSERGMATLRRVLFDIAGLTTSWESVIKANALLDELQQEEEE